MGYDRNDPWMTCGERDDREVGGDELARVVQVAFNESRDGFETHTIAAAILLKFIVLRRD